MIAPLFASTSEVLYTFSYLNSSNKSSDAESIDNLIYILKNLLKLSSLNIGKFLYILVDFL
jgi:hypothetical protein